MNRRLLDPFQATELPEVIEEYLEQGVAKCAAFNRRGTLLAAGTVEGYVVIWDFDTRGMAKLLRHANSLPPSGSAPVTVTSVCWSRDGRHLASGSLDQRVVLWDVEQGSKVFEFQLESAVTHVSMSPKKPYKILATLATTAPVLLDVEANTAAPLPSISLEPGRTAITILTPAVAVFAKDGSTVLVGQAKGLLTLYDTDTLRVVDVIKIPGAPKVLGMVLNWQGTLLLLNCNDRIVRMFKVGSRGNDLPGVDISQLSAAIGAHQAGRSGSQLLGDRPLVTPSHQFHNVVERTHWRGVAFSADCEHVAAAAVAKEDHNIYIWACQSNTPRLEMILEGPCNEMIVDLVWHPCRSMLVSISSNGRIYIWAKIFDESWSAFAPDFQVLDENEEYVEREEEFDESPVDEAAAAAAADVAGDDEEEEVDVLTMEEAAAFSSDDEDDKHALHYLTAEVQLDGPGLAEADEGAAAGQQNGSNGEALPRDTNGEQAGTIGGSITGPGPEGPSAQPEKRSGQWDNGDTAGTAKRSRPNEAGPSRSTEPMGASGYEGNGSGPSPGGVSQIAADGLVPFPAAPAAEPGSHHSMYTSSYSGADQQWHS